MKRVVVARPGTLVTSEMHGCSVVHADDWEIRGNATLFLAANVKFAPGVVKHGFQLLEKWDMAVPLWKFEITAEAVGSPDERERTLAITGDLRIPVYATDAVFVRNNETGREFISTWRAECGDEQLAFLRALFLVKPIFCALPATWLLAGPVELPTARAPGRYRQELVTVQIGPRQFVRCRPGDEQAVLKRFEKISAGQHG